MTEPNAFVDLPEEEPDTTSSSLLPLDDIPVDDGDALLVTTAPTTATIPSMEPVYDPSKEYLGGEVVVQEALPADVPDDDKRASTTPASTLLLDIPAVEDGENLNDDGEDPDSPPTRIRRTVSDGDEPPIPPDHESMIMAPAPACLPPLVAPAEELQQVDDDVAAGSEAAAMTLPTQDGLEPAEPLTTTTTATTTAAASADEAAPEVLSPSSVVAAADADDSLLLDPKEETSDSLAAAKEEDDTVMSNVASIDAVIDSEFDPAATTTEGSAERDQLIILSSVDDAKLDRAEDDSGTSRGAEAVVSPDEEAGVGEEEKMEQPADIIDPADTSMTTNGGAGIDNGTTLDTESADTTAEPLVEEEESDAAPPVLISEEGDEGNANGDYDGPSPVEGGGLESSREDKLVETEYSASALAASAEDAAMGTESDPTPLPAPSEPAILDRVEPAEQDPLSVPAEPSGPVDLADLDKSDDPAIEPVSDEDIGDETKRSLRSSPPQTDADASVPVEVRAQPQSVDTIGGGEEPSEGNILVTVDVPSENEGMDAEGAELVGPDDKATRKRPYEEENPESSGSNSTNDPTLELGQTDNANPDEPLETSKAKKSKKEKKQKKEKKRKKEKKKKKDKKKKSKGSSVSLSSDDYDDTSCYDSTSCDDSEAQDSDAPLIPREVRSSIQGSAVLLPPPTFDDSAEFDDADDGQLLEAAGSFGSPGRTGGPTSETIQPKEASATTTTVDQDESTSDCMKDEVHEASTQLESVRDEDPNVVSDDRIPESLSVKTIDIASTADTTQNPVDGGAQDPAPITATIIEASVEGSSVQVTDELLEPPAQPAEDSGLDENVVLVNGTAELLLVEDLTVDSTSKEDEDSAPMNINAPENAKTIIEASEEKSSAPVAVEGFDEPKQVQELSEADPNVCSGDKTPESLRVESIAVAAEDESPRSFLREGDEDTAPIETDGDAVQVGAPGLVSHEGVVPIHVDTKGQISESSSEHVVSEPPLELHPPGEAGPTESEPPAANGEACATELNAVDEESLGFHSDQVDVISDVSVVGRQTNDDELNVQSFQDLDAVDLSAPREQTETACDPEANTSTDRSPSRQIEAACGTAATSNAVLDRDFDSSVEQSPVQLCDENSHSAAHLTGNEVADNCLQHHRSHESEIAEKSALPVEQPVSECQKLAGLAEVQGTDEAPDQGTASTTEENLMLETSTEVEGSPVKHIGTEIVNNEEQFSKDVKSAALNRESLPLSVVESVTPSAEEADALPSLDIDSADADFAAAPCEGVSSTEPNLLATSQGPNVATAAPFDGDEIELLPTAELESFGGAAVAPMPGRLGLNSSQPEVSSPLDQIVSENAPTDAAASNVESFCAPEGEGGSILAQTSLRPIEPEELLADAPTFQVKQSVVSECLQELDEEKSQLELVPVKGTGDTPNVEAADGINANQQDLRSMQDRRAAEAVDEAIVRVALEPDSTVVLPGENEAGSSEGPRSVQSEKPRGTSEGDGATASLAPAACDLSEAVDQQMSDTVSPGQPTTMLVLVSTQALKREVVANQQMAFTVLSALKIPYESLDGSLPANQVQRNELFALSGLRGQYPQFFKKSPALSGMPDTSFYGDWDQFQWANECGMLRSDFGTTDGAPESKEVGTVMFEGVDGSSKDTDSREAKCPERSECSNGEVEAPELPSEQATDLPQDDMPTQASSVTNAVDVQTKDDFLAATARQQEVKEEPIRAGRRSPIPPKRAVAVPAAFGGPVVTEASEAEQQRPGRRSPIPPKRAVVVPTAFSAQTDQLRAGEHSQLTVNVKAKAVVVPPVFVELEAGDSVSTIIEKPKVVGRTSPILPKKPVVVPAAFGGPVCSKEPTEIPLQRPDRTSPIAAKKPVVVPAAFGGPKPTRVIDDEESQRFGRRSPIIPKKAVVVPAVFKGGVEQPEVPRRSPVTVKKPAAVLQAPQSSASWFDTPEGDVSRRSPSIGSRRVLVPAAFGGGARTQGDVSPSSPSTEKLSVLPVPVDGRPTLSGALARASPEAANSSALIPQVSVAESRDVPSTTQMSRKKVSIPSAFNSPDSKPSVTAASHPYPAPANRSELNSNSSHARSKEVGVAGAQSKLAIPAAFGESIVLDHAEKSVAASATEIEPSSSSSRASDVARTHSRTDSKTKLSIPAAFGGGTKASDNLERRREQALKSSSDHVAPSFSSPSKKLTIPAAFGASPASRSNQPLQSQSMHSTPSAKLQGPAPSSSRGPPVPSPNSEASEERQIGGDFGPSLTKRKVQIPAAFGSHSSHEPTRAHSSTRSDPRARSGDVQVPVTSPVGRSSTELAPTPNVSMAPVELFPSRSKVAIPDAFGKASSSTHGLGSSSHHSATKVPPRPATSLSSSSHHKGSSTAYCPPSGAGTASTTNGTASTSYGSRRSITSSSPPPPSSSSSKYVTVGDAVMTRAAAAAFAAQEDALMNDVDTGDIPMIRRKSASSSPAQVPKKKVAIPAAFLGGAK